jgi:hypothetical protein
VVIESMGVHENMPTKLLSNKAVAKGLAGLEFDILMERPEAGNHKVEL